MLGTLAPQARFPQTGGPQQKGPSCRLEVSKPGLPFLNDSNSATGQAVSLGSLVYKCGTVITLESHVWYSSKRGGILEAPRQEALECSN